MRHSLGYNSMDNVFLSDGFVIVLHLYDREKLQ